VLEEALVNCQSNPLGRTGCDSHGAHCASTVTCVREGRYELTTRVCDSASRGCLVQHSCGIVNALIRGTMSMPVNHDAAPPIYRSSRPKRMQVTTLVWAIYNKVKHTKTLLLSVYSQSVCGRCC
jgi:hypothetical protein